MDATRAVANSSAVADFLAGGGEMGRRMRAFDWAAHPLGAPDRWPQALRTVVRLMLTTNHPMFIFWGSEHFCFYNDAYSASIGPEKHPAMLGARGREMWDEIWPIIGPQIAQVMAGEGATWHEDQLVPIIRHGGLKEVYWTYSFSPIDHADSVGGVLVLCTETTDRVLAQRRREAEFERFREAFRQAPSFAAILSGPLHRFDFINDAYRQLIGRRDVVGMALCEALPEVKAQGFHDLLDRVYATGEAYVGRSVPVALARGAAAANETRLVDFVYQPMRDEAGAVSGIFVEGYDVTERNEAETALRESEARLAAELAAAERLQEVSTTLLREDDIEALYGRIMDAAMAIMRADFASIQLFDPERGELRLLGFRGFSPDAAAFWEWVRPASESTCGVALRTGQRCIVEDVRKCDFMTGSADLETYLQTGILAVQTTPLVSRRGELLGMISTHWSAPNSPADGELRLLDVLARQAADVLERRAAQAALSQSEARFRAAVGAMQGVLWTNNARGEMEGEQPGWAALTGQSFAEYQGYGWANAVHLEDSQPTIDAWHAALAERRMFLFEHRVRCADGTFRNFSLRAIPLIDNDGTLREWVGVHTDITERHRAEEQRQLLIGELNHRVKNTLATVQAIAAQSFRGQRADTQARASFEARLQALAKAHDVLSRENWEGASLYDVVTTALGPYRTRDGQRVEIEGPETRLSPHIALPLAMTLHELATNAAKYGALSVESGVVSLQWTLRASAIGAMIDLSWRERGGPAVKKPTAAGFGTRLIEVGLRHVPGGEVALRYEKAGVSCSISAPVLG